MYEALFKPASRRIIDALLAEHKSLSKLAEELELAKSTLQQKHLKPLEDLGIVKKTLKKSSKGQEAYYELRRFSLFHSIDPESGSAVTVVSTVVFDLPQLLLEQLEENEFKNDLDKLLKKITKMKDTEEESNYIILFGSVARGEGTWKSDIDIALIRRVWNTAIMNEYLEKISMVIMETHHQIKPQFLVLQDFINGKSLLIKEMKQSGIVIYGDRFGRPEVWRQMERYKSITL